MANRNIKDIKCWKKNICCLQQIYKLLYECKSNYDDFLWHPILCVKGRKRSFRNLQITVGISNYDDFFVTSPSKWHSRNWICSFNFCLVSCSPRGYINPEVSNQLEISFLIWQKHTRPSGEQLLKKTNFRISKKIIFVQQAAPVEDPALDLRQEDTE